MNDQPTIPASDDGALNIQIREYVDLARRRKLWILLIALGISLTIAVVAMRLPNIYRAETVILINPQKVSEGIVPQTVTGNVADRLSTIRQEVMSPTQLAGLIKEMNLYPSLRGKVSDQQLVAMMIKSTSIDVLDSGGQRLSSFRVAFTDTDRNQVAPVAERLASLFIERSQKARVNRVNETSKFLESELEETRRQLEEKERLVQDVKSRHTEDMTESRQYHLEAINALRDQLRNSQEQVNRDRQSKVYLQSMAGLNAPTIDLDQGAAVKSPYQVQLQKLESQLKDMQVHYGPNYPEVRKLQNSINELKAKAESEKGSTEVADPQPAETKHGVRNPVVEAEVNKLEQDMADETRKQGDLEKQIQYHLAKVQQAPIFEQQIADLMRDYDAIRNHYNQLQARRLDTELASELETHEAPDRFEFLDHAVAPEGPSGPRRGFMIGGGLFFGLLCGLGVAFLVEVSDESVRHEREASQIFGKPVLAGIPKITSVQERMRSRWLVASMTAGTAAGAVAIGLILSRFVS